MRKRQHFGNTFKSAFCWMLGFCVIAAAPGAMAASAPIDEQGAQELALADAGAQSADATRLHTRFEREDGVEGYNVDFHLDGLEYEYLIRESDGMILEWSVDGKDVGDAVAELTLLSDNDRSGDASLDNNTGSNGASGDDSLDSNTGSNGASGDASLDSNTGSGDASGDSSPDNNANSNDASGTGEQGNTAPDGADAKTKTLADGTEVIGIEKAMAAVLQDAGISDADARFTKLKFEYDGKYYDYEIEFIEGRTEYEYTLDATTGEILESDWD